MKKTRAPRPKWTKACTDWGQVKLIMSVDEAAWVIGTTRQTIYNMVKDGRLHKVGDEKKTRISKAELMRYVEGNESHD